MNWNGQREALNHLIAKRESPADAASLQQKFNQSRRATLRSALNVRPVFLPLQFVMNAAGQTNPYRAMTAQLSYDVIIVGLKTDVQNRDIIIERTEDSKPIVYVGDATSLYLRSDDLAGLSADAGGGQLGTFFLPSPIILPANNRISVKMFKTDTTAAIETDNIVLIGVRVFNKTYGDTVFDLNQQRQCEEFITAYEVPRVVVLKALVNFDSAIAGGQARNILFPQSDTPLLIRGIRTTLRQCTVQGFRVQDEPNWMPSAVPVWAVAGEDEMIAENYNWFPRPIYLRSGSQLEIERIVNSIDGTLIDTQNNNQISVICQTP